MFLTLESPNPFNLTMYLNHVNEREGSTDFIGTHMKSDMCYAELL